MQQTNHSLLILGAGQYGMVAKELAESMGVFSEIAFLDDNNPAAIGKLNEYEKFIDHYTHAVVAIGNAVLRLELLKKLEKVGFEIPFLKHATAYVSPSASIGKGCFIEPMAVIHTDVVIESACIISAGTIVNHNSRIGAGCHINCGCVVKARAEIAPRTRTGYNEVCDTLKTEHMAQHGKMPVAV